MGSNNAGGVNLGGENAGFNPAAMMASIAVGGVVGQNIASVMSGAISQTNTIATAPPIPKVAYNVVKNGASTGPFSLASLTEMASLGELTPDTLVWKQGMLEWKKASDVDELRGLFPPPIN